MQCRLVFGSRAADPFLSNPTQTNSAVSARARGRAEQGPTCSQVQIPSPPPDAQVRPLLGGGLCTVGPSWSRVWSHEILGPSSAATTPALPAKSTEFREEETHLTVLRTRTVQPDASSNQPVKCGGVGPGSGSGDGATGCTESGTTVCPAAFSPHATTTPSARFAIVILPPAEISVKTPVGTSN